MLKIKVLLSIQLKNYVSEFGLEIVINYKKYFIIKFCDIKVGMV